MYIEYPRDLQTPGAGVDSFRGGPLNLVVSAASQQRQTDGRARQCGTYRWAWGTRRVCPALPYMNYVNKGAQSQLT